MHNMNLTLSALKNYFKEILTALLEKKTHKEC